MSWLFGSRLYSCGAFSGTGIQVSWFWSVGLRPQVEGVAKPEPKVGFSWSDLSTFGVTFGVTFRIKWALAYFS